MQSSVYFAGINAAANANMTNGTYIETTQTATDFGAGGTSEEWVRMDFGQKSKVRTIYIGCDFDGDLGFFQNYTESCEIQYSDDATTWTYFGSTGTFSTGIKTFAVSFDARYIRIVNYSANAVVTEFYAVS